MKRIVLSLFLIAATLLTTEACKKDSKIKVEKNHRNSTGDSANDLLSSSNYEKLLVEIQYMKGFRPTESAIENLRQMLTSRLNKPGGITFVYTEIDALGYSSYSMDDIRKIENDNRTAFTSKKEIATYFLFLDGEYSENTNNSSVLGIAYYNTSMVIFEKTLKDNTGGFMQPDLAKVETTVINHEFVHIMGLVNVGTPMQNFHQDTEHGAHCDNENCLMYWEAETGDMLSNLVGNTPIPTFDENCIKDLKANGGK
ncbi:MAG: membrane metalloprotease [Crocinitomicaceae bacterium]|jgi:hypothetical protein|nr:membrane metalloprotease [Crocinitomicaceae bacterium]